MPPKSQRTKPTQGGTFVKPNVSSKYTDDTSTTKNTTHMVGIAIYLFVFLAGLFSLVVCLLSGQFPEWATSYHLPITCGMAGGFGGVVYCLRGLYLNYSVKKQWGKEWYPWYVIRPFVSILTGGVSFLFLKAGLLVLEAQSEATSSNFGFYALAFIAGLNVDKFISKIEDLAQATWGIEKSRASKKENE